MNKTERNMRLLFSLPDSILPSSHTIRIPLSAKARINIRLNNPDTLVSREYNPPVGIQQGRSSDGVVSLDQLPPELVKVAQMSIVRGGRMGIVGNIKEVIEARRLVQRCLEMKNFEDVDAICSEWKERMCRSDLYSYEKEDEGSGQKRTMWRRSPRMKWEMACRPRRLEIDLPLLCPSCKSPI